MSNTNMNVEDLQAKIEQLNKELAEAKQKNTKTPTLKISEKKCVQINGIRRFPITFYKNELRRILSMATEIEAFIEENDSELK